MADTTQYLTLGIDQELFGIDIRSVREILDMRPISKLPHAPPFLLGMIDVRGAGYPILDLRTKLHLPRIEPTNATRIIILDVPLRGRTIGVGFVADRVLEVTGLDQTEAAPDVGGRWESNYIAGIGRKGDAFVIIFDLERLMASDEEVLESHDIRSSDRVAA
jgi:purine-binding chemotaxis protein CheW